MFAIIPNAMHADIHVVFEATIHNLLYHKVHFDIDGTLDVVVRFVVHDLAHNMVLVLLQ